MAIKRIVCTSCGSSKFVSKYNIGDKVTYIGTDAALIEGRQGTIAEVHPTLRVEVDKGFLWTVQEKDLIKV